MTNSQELNGVILHINVFPKKKDHYDVCVEEKRYKEIGI